MPPNRITMREIAKKIGVHFTTVSRALSNHPSIPENTRNHIQSLAKELGYSPDPMLSALTVYRTAKRKPAYRGNLAWITNATTRNGWRELCNTFVMYLDGAKAKAQELGYDIEEFWLKDPELNWKRASEILYARNIRGLLLPPQSHAKVRVKLDWPKFAAVTFGFTLAWPQLNTTATNTFLSMQVGVRQARARGYRRIGLIISKFADMRINHGWLGGFLVLQHSWPRSERIPVCQENCSNKKAILTWAKKYKPDVIVSHDDHAYMLLQKAGYKIPEDIAYFSPAMMNHSPEISGINEQPEVTGATAVNLLVGMINRGEWGIPELPIRVFTEGKWHEGKTLPRKTSF